VIELPRGAQVVADALARRGFVVVIVGGAVRDTLAGLDADDIDIATDAVPSCVRAALSGVPELEAFWDVGEGFGTIGVKAAGSHIEITTLRAPEEAGGHGVEDRFAADAAHRDLTINSIGMLYPEGRVMDPWGGRADLSAGLLRAVGDPLARLREDPLRVLRVARFASQLGFDVEPQTRAALAAGAPMLANVASERVRDETTLLILGEKPDRGLLLLHESGALSLLLPEVAALAGMKQPTFHDLDGLGHTIATVSATPPDRVLRWAALLHDIGKPPTRTVDNEGRIRFFRHAQVGASLAREVCVRLRLSNADRRRIVHLVERHMRYSELDTDNPRAVDRAVRRMDLWDENSDPPRALVTAEDMVELVAADVAATTARARAAITRDRLLDAIAQSRSRGVSGRTVSPLDGNDIMRLLGVKQGPQVGRLKNAVSAAVAEGRLAEDDREGALEVARRALDTPGASRERPDPPREA
jgi:poly(A) polymerase